MQVRALIMVCWMHRACDRCQKTLISKLVGGLDDSNYGGRVWIEFIWLRFEPNSGFF
jgi:hypothetical protein